VSNTLTPEVLSGLIANVDRQFDSFKRKCAYVLGSRDEFNQLYEALAPEQRYQNLALTSAGLTSLYPAGKAEGPTFYACAGMPQGVLVFQDQNGIAMWVLTRGDD
jgi:hypothetical protein